MEDLDHLRIVDLFQPPPLFRNGLVDLWSLYPKST